ncbi:MAG: hypothetical protein MHM6MM_005846 [Cercozoa sp. M6MM]
MSPEAETWRVRQRRLEHIQKRIQDVLQHASAINEALRLETGDQSKAQASTGGFLQAVAEIELTLRRLLQELPEEALRRPSLSAFAG